jgi:VWFA-related protein
VACSLSFISAGLTQQAHQLQVTSVVTDAWPAVQATITLTDAGGRPVSGLSAPAFRASSGDTVLPVTAATTISNPEVGIAVVLTIDVSGSMAGEPLAEAKAAAKALTARLGTTDQAAVVSFSNQPAVVQGFTADKPALDRAIDALAAGGNTALYAAVQTSTQLAEQAPLPRRAVVLLSDGLEYGTGGGVSADQTLQLVAGSNTLFMTVGLGASVDSQYLTNLARSGHGQYLVAPAPADLQAVYTVTADVLRQQYVLTLDASALQPAPGALPLELPLEIEANAGASTVRGAGTFRPPARALQATPSAGAPLTGTPAATAGAGDSNASSSPLPVVLLAGGGVAIVTAGGLLALVIRRRRRQRTSLEPERFVRKPAPVEFPAIRQAGSGEQPRAWLELPGGEQYPLGDSPVTIGTTRDCLIVLPNDAGGTEERARIWRRDGRYMLHSLSLTGSLKIAGRPVTWVVLEDGDAIQFGLQTVIFRHLDLPLE